MSRKFTQEDIKFDMESVMAEYLCKKCKYTIQLIVQDVPEPVVEQTIFNFPDFEHVLPVCGPCLTTEDAIKITKEMPK